MGDCPKLSFNYDRKFGVEIEICAFDKRNFKTHPLQKSELPEGIYDVGCVISDELKTAVDVMKWHLTHNNHSWVLKPDSSCGIEICSPVTKGWNGIKEVCTVVEALGKDPRIAVDGHCGLHIHLDISDCMQNDYDKLGSVLSHWIKCESVFLDSVPPDRKRNKYCQQIGITPMFQADARYSAADLLNKLGALKYYSINTFHCKKGSRQTVEFRIIEGNGCLDPYLLKNWIRLIVHFVERAKLKSMPPPYDAKNPWSSLLWLDPKEVFELLGFYEPLSKGLEETRNWFLARLKKNSCLSGLNGVWEDRVRHVSQTQIQEIISSLGLDDATLMSYLHPKNMREALYSAESKT